MTQKPSDNGVRCGITADARFYMVHAPNEKFEETKPSNHAVIKPATEFNELLLVVRKRHVEAYVNGVAVCNPVLWEEDLKDLRFGFAVSGPYGTRVELERLTLWSADGLPTLEERVKQSKAPK